MTEIQELEQKLRDAKYQESVEAWKTWHEEGKKFLDRLVGKCFIYRPYKDSFNLFKITSYNTQAVMGVKHPGYFVINTEGYFHINSAKWTNAMDLPKEEGTYGTFSLVSLDKKGKRVDVSQLNYKAENLANHCGLQDNRVTTIGRYGYDEKQHKESYDKWACCENKPEKSVANEFIGLFTYEVDESLYNDAKIIADRLAIDTLELWKKHEETLKNATRVKWTEI